ncbi:MAG: NAD dependent epimerase/dehydratase family protein [Candidatus Xenolissoclinum pacificiensis L6]|uniref:NAD dependent epimerase/dehydratase family protein n=1 Tax=Candidatus Xenolissoclinum pacificiensis L6 TaxID=1401685 RepID=W2UY33_9RICK|nr:MAG: NAD dependent epimerase/dehydratase family protein [Candidatus Xenolissoclinum pacificiensis L6]
MLGLFMQDRKTIVILGGGGFIGSYLVESLVQNGHLVKVVGRDIEKMKQLRMCGCVGQVILHSCNILDLELLTEITVGADVIINLVGILDQQDQRFDDIHVRGVENVISVVRKNSIKYVVHLSAFLEDGNKANYATTKLQGEKILRTISKQLLLVRPSVVFGKQDNFLNLFGRLLSILPIMPVMRVSKYRLQPLYVMDLVTFITKAIELSYVGCCDAVGPKSYSILDILLLVKKTIHSRVYLLPVPNSLYKFFAYFCQHKISIPFTKIITGNTRYLSTVDQVITLEHDNSNVVANSGLKGFLNKLYTLEELAEEVLRPYIIS